MVSRENKYGIMALYVYRVVLPLALSAALLPVIVIAIFKKGLRRHIVDNVMPHISELIGIVPKNTVKVIKNKKCAWLHAVSVGEVAALKPVWDELIKKLDGDLFPVIVTTCKEAEAKALQVFPEAEVIFAPLDFAPFVHSAVKTLNPSIALISETDLWPELLHSFKNNGTKTFLVNARISSKVASSCRAFSSLASYMFSCLSGAFFSTKVDYLRLKTFLEKVPYQVTGNVKCDSRPPEKKNIKALAEKLGLGDERENVLVAGSTHAGEEKMLLSAFKALKSEHSELKMIIAPRNLVRIHEVKLMSQEKGFSVVLKSDFDKIVASHCGNRYDKIGDWDVMVLDTMGELAVVYGIGKIAFVGGSLVPMDGHNMLEPVQAGAYALFGPYHRNFRDIGFEIARVKAGRIVKSETLFSDIRESLDLSEDCVRRAAERYNFECRGAALRTATAIDDIIRAE